MNERYTDGKRVYEIVEIDRRNMRTVWLDVTPGCAPTKVTTSYLWPMQNAA